MGEKLFAANEDVAFEIVMVGLIAAVELRTAIDEFQVILLGSLFAVIDNWIDDDREVRIRLAGISSIVAYVRV